MKLSTALEIRLYDTLKRIAKGYQTPDQIRREAERENGFGGFGPDYEEYLEMAYENIQQLAANAIRGVRIGRP